MRVFAIAAAAILGQVAVGPALAQETGQAVLGNGMEAYASFGRSTLFLPSVHVTTLTDDLVTQYQSQLEDLSGRVDGNRLDVGLDHIPFGMVSGQHWAFGVKGFYADLTASNDGACDAVPPPGGQLCIFLPLYDPDALIQGDFAGSNVSQWEIHTDRKVNNWGVAVEAQPFADRLVGSLKDEPRHVLDQSPWRLGLAVKGIDETVNLSAFDTATDDPVSLNERINTAYYGAYVGFVQEARLGQGLAISVNGEIGLYYAKTDFNGTYHASDAAGGLGFGGALQEINQTLSLSQSKAAAIASLKATLTKDLGAFKFGVSAQGDWYSYVPDVHYNNSDHTPNPNLDLIGTNDGTSLGSAQALGYTLAGRVTIPMSN